MTSGKLLIPALIILLEAVSCSSSRQYQYLQKTDSLAVRDGVYWFGVSLSDNDIYDIGIALRYNVKTIQADSVELDVCLISPRGDKSVERLGLPLSGSGKEVERAFPVTVGGFREIEWRYRKGVTVNGHSAGLWKVGIEPVGKDLYSAIEGIGLYCYGKR